MHNIRKFDDLVLLPIAFLFLVIFTFASPFVRNSQSAYLTWVDNIPTRAVSGLGAKFQVKLVNAEKAPDEYQLWIDSNFGKIKIDLAEEDPNDSLQEGKIYSTTLYALSEDDTTIITQNLDPNQPKPLPKTFGANFWFDFKIEGTSIVGNPEDPNNNPADPNNRVIILGKSDTDHDGIEDAIEGAEILPETYWNTNQLTYPYESHKLASLITSGGRITLKINDGIFKDVHLVKEDDPNMPEDKISDLTFPLGFLSFRVINLEDEETDLKILFPMKISSYAQICRYHSKNWWAQIEEGSKYEFDQGEAWSYEEFSDEGFQEKGIIVKMKDYTEDNNNLKFDSDPEEGTIQDPLGLGIPKESSGGRCFIYTLLPTINKVLPRKKE